LKNFGVHRRNKMRKILFVLLLLVFFPLAVSASLGPDVSVTADGKVLRWEEGSRDYFVMFKSLVEDRHGNATFRPENPQADSCIDYNTGSTFTLESRHIPDDAYVEAAYLVWTAGADPSLFSSGNTDNSVTLSFFSQDGAISLNRDITSTVAGTFQTPPSFEYESLKSGIASTGYFTYRVEVTDFMQEIIEKGREEGSAFDGFSLLGDYNVKNMDCTNHNNYVSRSLMVGDWVLLFVYTSEKIRPKKIYVYNGFSEYQHTFEDIMVTGFELPDEAEMKLTMVVHEGDPGNVSGTQHPEALMLSGASTFDWVLFSNICNPPLVYSGMNYVEVFNSVSSVFGWEETVPNCVGGVPPNYDMNNLQYALDVDTFVLSAMDPLFAPHLIKGDDHLWLKVSANQDVIYTNLLVLSIDTKRPKFDIPPNPDTPDGREKNYCSCSTDDDAVCIDRPFYFTIKVENWGENIANNVTVKDVLPPLVEYIPGTTEILVKKEGVTGNWKKIADGTNGQFPLTDDTEIADSMYYCNKATYECEDSILIRFKVKPIDTIQKHDVIQNTAIITDSSGIKYYSNSSVPLRLRLGNCPSITECSEPPLEQCGGGPDCCEECVDDDDCGNGTCVDGQCVGETADLTKDSEITFAEGINSPKSEETAIIIPNPSENLVVGQFTLLATGDKEKSFEFLGVNISAIRNDNDTVLKNFRLVHDAGGTGSVNDGDKTLATVENMTADSVNLTIFNEPDRIFSADTLHNFLIVLDAEYNGETVTNVRFNVQINGPEAILVKDSGKAEVKGEKIAFEEFRFEPTNGFIVTKGLNDPQVPSLVNMSGVVPVLQIRTKSMQGGDTVDSISVKTIGQSVPFGSGIGKVYLYHDKDKDGKISSGDEMLGESSKPEANRIIFESLNIPYSEGEEKYFVIALDLKLNVGEQVQIQIPRAGLKLDRDSTDEIAELPVTSKIFEYDCQEGDPECQSYLDDIVEPGPCKCTIVVTPESGSVPFLLSLLFFLSVFAIISLRKGRKDIS
jgi:uncharacterized repeat protein (TIGR01451 family)